MNAAHATTTLYLPAYPLSRALGPDPLAEQLEQWARTDQRPVTIVRNGSRGLYWLEPLLEVQPGDQTRLAYGPMTSAGLAELLETTDWQQGAPAHPLYLGNIEEHPYLANQDRLSFARIGLFDPTDIESYQQHEGFVGLRNALSLGPQGVLDQVMESGLRGRGGAAFPTGIKWQTVADAVAGPNSVDRHAD